MDKHPQITNSLSLVVREFYRNRERKQVTNQFKIKK